ncbi:hypothetical protein SDC9_129632 [bioreactor metagenome]|uniref:Uncharacterized protein n=1 Tax=bioreactor metagenome TaxID=1076179 RepID=A0A645D0C7_9ZZZZ
MGGRDAAAGVGVVHHVVMDQGGDVQQLQARGGPDQGGVRVVIGAAGRCDIAPQGERRAQPLAASGEHLGELGHRLQLGADPRQDLPLFGEEAGQGVLDVLTELGGERLGGIETVDHGLSLGGPL